MANTKLTTWRKVKLGGGKINAKVKMQKSKLRLKIVKNINGEDKVCVLRGKYLSHSEYIQDLINQLKRDIFPLFRVKGFAPFTISRNIFCFIDHVSVLRYGIKRQKGEQTKRIKKLISEFAKFDSYINSKYKLYADYIIQIYRHDLVHNVRPLPHEFQVIEKNGKGMKGISWFLTSSYIKDSAPKPRTFNKLADYFKNVKNRKNLCHLRYAENQIVINNYCLFFDFVNYLKKYKKVLENDQKSQNNFTKNYQQIIKNHFEIKNFTLNKKRDKECEVRFI